MINYESKARIEKGTYKGRSPLFEKLMTHGFTQGAFRTAQPQAG